MWWAHENETEKFLITTHSFSYYINWRVLMWSSSERDSATPLTCQLSHEIVNVSLKLKTMQERFPLSFFHKFSRAPLCFVRRYRACWTIRESLSRDSRAAAKTEAWTVVLIAKRQRRRRRRRDFKSFHLFHVTRSSSFFLIFLSCWICHRIRWMRFHDQKMGKKLNITKQSEFSFFVRSSPDLFETS